MSPELDQKLCEKYPLIMAERKLGAMETAMCWGFECGDGWYNIIETLCALLTSEYRQAKDSYDYAKQMFEENGGKTHWGKPITAEDLEEKRLKMEEAEKRIPVASQVKEKFGGLS